MKLIRAAFAAAIIATLAMSASVSATQPVNGEHKVGICHRTASDTNPYVYIEVDVAAADEGDSLSDHLGNNDTGHKQTYWKSDGTFRGVSHVDGDPKDDYLAASAADCEDFTSEPSTTPSEAPSTEPSVEPSVTPSVEPSVVPSVEPSSTPNETKKPVPSQPNTAAYSDPPASAPTGSGSNAFLLLALSFIVMWAFSEALFANERPRR